MNYSDALWIFEITSLKGQTHASLKKIYHHLATKHHPDKGGSSEDFIRLRAAYTLLREYLTDPKYASGEYDSQQSSSNWKSTDSSANESTNSRTRSSYQSSYNPNSSTDFSAEIEQLRRERDAYKEAYDRMNAVVQDYEKVFNDQIRTINNTHKKVSSLYDRYEAQRQSLKQHLDEQLTGIKERYERKWWQHVVRVPKITEQEFIVRHNKVVGEFNTAVRQLDDEFLNNLLALYQTNLSEIIDLLKT